MLISRNPSIRCFFVRVSDRHWRKSIYGTESARRSTRCVLEKERSEQLLLNILPAPIIARLKSGETVIADHVSDVTILFADFVGFTELSSRLSAPELVAYWDAFSRV